MQSTSEPLTEISFIIIKRTLKPYTFLSADHQYSIVFNRRNSMKRKIIKKHSEKLFILVIFTLIVDEVLNYSNQKSRKYSWRELRTFFDKINMLRSLRISQDDTGATTNQVILVELILIQKATRKSGMLRI